jgi:predicted  nucleic acid-binding Zn-ribbon protein
MKCPKCGYNSFEYYDTCKKCTNDLTGYKETYGIKSIVLPLEVRTGMAEALMAETALNAPAPDTIEVPADMFSFDLPAGESTQNITDDPFNFDDDPIPSPQAGGDFSRNEDQQSAQAKAEEDAFADLLESTSQMDAEPATPAAAVANSNAGESDLGSFSWDDTPNPLTNSSAKPAEDDFNSLFGESDDSAKK